METRAGFCIAQHLQKTAVMLTYGAKMLVGKGTYNSDWHGENGVWVVFFFQMMPSILQTLLFTNVQ